MKTSNASVWVKSLTKPLCSRCAYGFKSQSNLFCLTPGFAESEPEHGALFHPAADQEVDSAHQHKRFKENVYNTSQWAEQQRGLEAKATLRPGGHVGLEDSLNSTWNNATNFMCLQQIKLGQFRGFGLSCLSVLCYVVSLPGQHWDVGMEEDDST